MVEMQDLFTGFIIAVGALGIAFVSLWLWRVWVSCIEGEKALDEWWKQYGWAQQKAWKEWADACYLVTRGQKKEICIKEAVVIDRKCNLD